MSQLPESISPPLPASPAPLPGLENTLVPRAETGTAHGLANGSGAGDRHMAVAEAEKKAMPPKAGPQRIPRWLERAELFLRVILRMYIGLVVCYLPWSARLPIFQPMSRGFWDENPLFLQFPTLSIYAANGVVRGIVSGLGLLNLWIAFQDAARDRDW